MDIYILLLLSIVDENVLSCEYLHEAWLEFWYFLRLVLNVRVYEYIRTTYDAYVLVEGFGNYAHVCLCVCSVRVLMRFCVLRSAVCECAVRICSCLYKYTNTMLCAYYLNGGLDTNLCSVIVFIRVLFFHALSYTPPYASKQQIFSGLREKFVQRISAHACFYISYFSPMIECVNWTK